MANLKPYFSNNKQFVITHMIHPTTTTIRVHSGQGLTIPSDYTHIVGTLVPMSGVGDLEIVHIIKIEDNEFIIERAQENTAALSFLPGAVLEVRLTAESLNTFSLSLKALTSPLNLLIPRDFPNLQEAVDYASQYIAIRNVGVLIEFEEGYFPDSGVTLKGRNCSLITISSKSSGKLITLSSSFVGRFIHCEDGVAPVLDAYVKATGSGLERVYSLINSQGSLTPGSGGEGAYGRPLYVNTGHVSAGQTVWRRFGDSIYFSAGSSGQLGSSLVEEVSFLANGALTVSRGSSVEAQNIVFKQCSYPIEVKRAGSSLNAHGAVIEDCSRRIARITRRGALALTGATITGVGDTGIEVYGGELDIGEGASITGGSLLGYGIHANGASSVNATNVTIEGFSTGILAEGASLVDAAGGEIKNNASLGIHAQRGAVINMNVGNVTNNPQDARVTQGGIIALTGATTSNSVSPGTPNVIDTNLNGFGGLNSVSSNRGIIWG
ncbi:hypothetical protein vBAfQDWS535_11 [Alcaligenes phage vB_Af_QDWS535]|nr:hypothetical protein vBAfQDWS535_11 [Alcaligenes phage vB_Af_QDWS535]